MLVIKSHIKKLIVLATILIAIVVGVPSIPGALNPNNAFQPREAYAQGMPSNVKTAYVKKAKSLAKQVKSKLAHYKFVDVYGSSVPEMLCVTKSDYGSGSNLYIYTYTNNKVKLLLEDGLYGDDGYKFYKKTKSFILHRSGHGGDAYIYYQMKGSKYTAAMTKGRYMSPTTSLYSSWSYYDSVAKKNISKTTFTKKAKKMQVGNCKKVSGSYKWAYLRV
jgi:hypothetical protein